MLTAYVQAYDQTSEGAVVIRRYTNPEVMEDTCRGCLEEIGNGIPSGKRVSVFILARYRFYRPQALDEWMTHWPTLDITFKTAHSSKGLQADYVIVLGLHTGRYAFPAEISDDPLLHLVMPQAESFPNAEERRLLYVAMTRARHRVYLLGGRNAPSVFISELVRDYDIRTMQLASDTTESENGKVLDLREICPECRNGTLVKRIGKFGEFFGCSTYPSCDYTRKAVNQRR